MPYISADGRVGDRKEWGLSTIPDFFWGIINFIVLFFRTLISPSYGHSQADSQTSSFGSSGRRPPGGGGPPRRFGRINHGTDSGPPMMGG